MPNQRCCLQADSQFQPRPLTFQTTPSPRCPTTPSPLKQPHRSPQQLARTPSCPCPSAELSQPPAAPLVPCRFHGMALRRICSKAFLGSKLRLPRLWFWDHPSHRPFLCTAVPFTHWPSARTSALGQDCWERMESGLASSFSSSLFTLGEGRTFHRKATAATRSGQHQAALGGTLSTAVT